MTECRVTGLISCYGDWAGPDMRTIASVSGSDGRLHIQFEDGCSCDIINPDGVYRDGRTFRVDKADRVSLVLPRSRREYTRQGEAVWAMYYAGKIGHRQFAPSPERPWAFLVSSDPDLLPVLKMP